MINRLFLQNFRNFEELKLEFDKDTTVISGINASGKTNILESIFFLATGKSFKAKINEECIKYNAEIARISGRVSKGHTLEIVLTRGVLDIGKSSLEKVAKKRLLVNGSGKRMVDFSGNLRVVLFAPQDLELVTESPSIRRKFLDTVLSQVDREYKRSILSYEKGLRQRNKLLFRIREENLPAGRQVISRSHLMFWNQLLIKNGDYISKKRQEFIEFVNRTKSLNKNKYELEYDKSAISEGRLEQYKNEEVAAATTLVGPHRDDFIFKHDDKDLSSYGSRGEQRMGVLWLKMAELSFIEKATGEKPTLLLDDIFSELDHQHRDVVIKIIENHQVIMTTADEHFLQDFKKDGTKIVKL